MKNYQMTDVCANDQESFLLLISGEEVGCVKRDPWIIEGSENEETLILRMGTTVEGFTVVGSDLDDLVCKMVAKRLELKAYRSKL